MRTKSRSAGLWISLALVSLALVLSTGCALPGASRNVSFWIVSGDEELAADTPPSLENDIYSAARGEVRLQAALNETFDLQIALHTAAPPAGPFDVRITDLTGPAETLPAASVTTLYRIQYARVEQFRSWFASAAARPATPGLFPDIAVPWRAARGGGPVTLADRRNEIIWADVHVPATATPGEYSGRIEVRRGRDATPVFTCQLRLEVLPVALPDRRGLAVICRLDAQDLLTRHLRWPRTAPEELHLLPTLPNHSAAVQLVNQTMETFQEHRTTPVLWGSFPKFRPIGEREVEVDWADYDQLVTPWLDGSGFHDRVRLEAWAVPATLDYPSAERNGGLESPRYARLLAAYLQECRRHFAERGWLERAFVRLAPPEPLTSGAVNQARRITGIVRQSEAGLPVVAHLPARSLRGLGWHEAPPIELPDVQIWAPPAMWYEPAAMERERKLGKRTWFMPDYPPYSGALTVEGPAADGRIIAWQAYRYGADAVWIEHAAKIGDTASSGSALTPWLAGGLIYPGEQYGVGDRPLASLRLKRLRRGLQDYALLRLLEDNGKRLLAQTLAGQIVRWACTDACLDNLVSCKETGWPRQTAVLRLARTLMLQELAGQFEPNPTARQRQIDGLSQWGLMMNQAERVVATVNGVRLSTATETLRADVFGSVLNTTNRPLEGRWLLPVPPPGWQQAAEVVTSLDAGTRRPVQLELSMTGLAYNIDGVYPFELAFNTAALGTFRVPARLAVAVCPMLDTAPTVDGRLDDWPLASNNAAGDFRLCRLSQAAVAAGTDLPALGTQAYCAMDRAHLYVGVRCRLKPGEPPVARADNTITIDGALPWGQDVVEVLIDPRGVATGTSSDLYCVQVKPTGLLVARKGCRTEPPMGTSETWPCGARVAVNIERDHWVVELAIPLTAFGAEARRNRVWGLNITRLDARHGEYSSWSGARGYCYTPAALGNLIMLWP